MTVDSDPARKAEETLKQDPLGDQELTFLLGTAFQVVLAEFVRRLNAAGYSELRPVHGMIFQILAGPGATSTELAERLGVTKQAAGQMVAELEKRGYVRRKMHPDGGRRRLIVLTDKALGHLTVAGHILHDLEAELAVQINDTNLATLRAELSRVVHAMVGDAIPPLRPIW
ncbi:MAG TPA: MarR family transcriptional regulator [Streptosporangiaceae bacterium]